MKLFQKEKKIRCHLEHNSYDIIVGSNILHKIGKLMTGIFEGNTIMVVTSSKIGAFYYPVVSASLRRAGFKVVKHVVPDGEGAKSEKELFRLLKALVVHRFERHSALVALGGGVIGDLTGFAASIYMRGIPFINIPTTLLAQVDSAVGGKTAINLKEGKNLVGSFYQPQLVVSDVSTLSTLPKKEMINGMAEVIKYGMIFDYQFFEYMEKNTPALFELEFDVLENVVSKCVKFKVKVVERDEKEKGLRAVLNFGHTFGHALETFCDYKKVTHGMAVALGMQAAARLAHALGMFNEESVERLRTLVQHAALPTSIKDYNASPARLVKIMYSDKKVKNKKIRLVLPIEIGGVVIRDDVKDSAIKEAFNF